MRLRPSRPNGAWSYDFVADWTQGCQPYRIMSLIDEYIRECVALPVQRKLNSKDVWL